MSDYRASHQGRDRGRIYDERYARGQTGAMWERVERPLLGGLFREFGGEGKSCLDFACGTGRITSLLVDHFDSVTGLDISGDMLEEAKIKCPTARFIQGDITREDHLVGDFDVVTSFRFFPNAEPDLRRKALSALAGHVRPGGIMIVNNHQNSTSLLGRLRSIAPGKRRSFLAPDALPRLLEDNGFHLVRTLGFSFLPVWRDWSLIPADLRARIEGRFVTMGRATNLALNLVHVARRNPV